MSKLKTIKKAVILAGGRGTRLSEQTSQIPKPMVKIGETPIIIHIMRRLAKHGINEFYILGGYMYEVIWYYLIKNNISTFPMSSAALNHLEVVLNDPLLNNAKVHLLDTGENSGTAERISQVKDYIGDENFIMTYGDSYSNVDVLKVEEQLNGNRIVSLCAVPYKERFGLVKVEEDFSVTEFKEKSESTTHFINGGYICLTPEIFNILKETHKDFSKDTLESEELKGKIGAYIHKGYWKAVDTQRDLEEINKDFITHKEYFII